MIKVSPASKRWLEVDARIQFFPEDELRQFFAAAAKFLIDSRHWDDRHPVTPFDERTEVRSFHKGFEQFPAERMRVRPAQTGEDGMLLDALRKASEFEDKPLRRRVAKKKLRKLRKRLHKRLARLDSTPRAFRGLRFYEGVLRQRYFRESHGRPTGPTSQ
jgi:hypothetical protein